MGYAHCLGACFCCHQPFYFNPLRVPSFRDARGEKQPVCKGCMTLVNQRREERGLDPFVYADDAYEPCREEELGDD